MREPPMREHTYFVLAALRAEAVRMAQAARLVIESGAEKKAGPARKLRTT